MSGDERQAKRIRFDESTSEFNNSLSESDSQLSTLSNYVDEKSEPKLEKNDPPLHTAIIAEDIDLIKKILSSGVDIDALDKEKNTALHLAVKNKYLPAIECLLEYGASISATNKIHNYHDGWGETPLHIAVKENRLDIVKLLLTIRLDVNKLIPNYETVLTHAFERKNFNLINHLIGNNYRSDRRDFIKKASNIFSQPPIEMNYQLKATLFEEYVSINNRDSHGDTPLILAVVNKNISMIELDNGADLNANTFDKHVYPTALHTAVKENDENLVKFLLNYDNCNVNADTNRNLTPFHIAVSKNNLTIVKMLIEKNGKHDIYGTDEMNYSDKVQPFHIAVYKNSIEITEYFLDIIKVDVNIKTENGGSALEIAAKANNIDMVKLLLNHGATVDYCHHISKKGLYYGGTPLHHAARNKNVEMVDLLLSKSANVNIQLNDGTSALHVAVHSRNEEIIKRLLDRDADVNAKMNQSSSDHDMTPILQATENNLIEIIKMLIKKGVNINDVAIINSKSMSIIDVIIKYDYRSTMLLTVLNLGADVNLSCIYEKERCNIHLKELIEKHILKLKAAKLFVNEKFNGWISRGPIEQQFFNKCKKEVKKMQKEKINQTSSFCYFDLLNEKADTVAEYVETNSLVPEFYNSLAGFPLYAEMLTCHFQRGQKCNKGILKNI